MQSKLKILVSAYACSPNHGSEPGMGWNFVAGLSKYHEVHVICEELKWKIEIEEELNKKPELKANLKFYFITKQRKKLLRKIWPPSYYWFYKKWQGKAYKLALELDQKEGFDLIHQLNMVGYREPGYLWKIKKPFVWGPIGGLENSPWSFLPSLGLKGLVFYTGRNVINLIQRNFSQRAKTAAQRSNAILIAATPSNKDFIKKLWGVNSELICEVGQEPIENEIVPSKREIKKVPLKIIWSGQHTPGKNLSLLLNALKDVDFPYQLDVLGNGEMTTKWQKQAEKNRVNVNCKWHGWIERQQAIEIMRNGNVFCITSISDLTATVTLEALSYGLPIICLDHCGFAHVVTSECGIKIPVSTPEQAQIDFAVALKKLYEDENYRQLLSAAAIQRASDFSWENKIEQLNAIYKTLCKKIE